MRFAEKLSSWKPLHTNAGCRAAHLLGGYLFVLAILVPLSLARLQVGPVELTAAQLAVAAIACAGLALELPAGALHAILLVPVLLAAERLAALPTGTALGIAAGVMVFRFAMVVGAHVLLERKTHGLELGGPVLFVVEPVYVYAFWLGR